MEGNSNLNGILGSDHARGVTACSGSKQEQESAVSSDPEGLPYRAEEVIQTSTTAASKDSSARGQFMDGFDMQ